MSKRWVSLNQADKQFFVQQERLQMFCCWLQKFEKIMNILLLNFNLNILFLNSVFLSIGHDAWMQQIAYLYLCKFMIKDIIRMNVSQSNVPWNVFEKSQFDRLYSKWLSAPQILQVCTIVWTSVGCLQAKLKGWHHMVPSFTTTVQLVKYIMY